MDMRCVLCPALTMQGAGGALELPESYGHLMPPQSASSGGQKPLLGTAGACR